MMKDLLERISKALEKPGTLIVVIGDTQGGMSYASIKSARCFRDI